MLDLLISGRLKSFEYSGRFYTACPVMENGDSSILETAIPEIQYHTEHMPKDHQKYLEWNGDRLCSWAARIDYRECK